ncbi:ribonuclease H-like domain-containing protein [Rhizophagus irregularis DAOM 181602=DAOM 197198]|uniref:Ribonuclease H-like domain-containing protein n=1 Tax=Rhizophagus irregularis (strain DAOM 181602 / DAOM 197198 / MUCL 43194) TaxID=747089 RepID=A0A2P4QJA2_RHIID|nr:ribonuclease H-like domain-containing protein [Rhizophagus irregularis DAOM 181602=DAOM 197198]POG77735.1 ribonuclease H-like domain-containing protein [Rhizophagus irregularis DAOM 181602=DAOM 197198]|eukprot:XP_025184601.1 ribonuclease H-like domain-containing protein [Rhizophagus irregularis DAOM 181602=DAOM 197198]
MASRNLDNLQENLKIAHQFYELANIHVNKDKTLILANKHAKKIIDRDSPSPTSYIEIEFGTVIKVPLLGKNKVARILGVYFNPDDDQRFLMVHINSLRKKGIMFLDHIITKDHAYLHEYNVIKESLIHKGGPQPRWYQFLKEHIATINNCNRLSIDLRVPLIQNSSAARPAIPPISIDTLHHPKRSQKWVVAWVPSISDIVYGKNLSTNHFPNSIPVSYIEHWVHRDISIIKIPPRLDRPIAPPQLSRPTFSNNTFINQLLEDDMIVKELQDIARTLNPFNVLVFYTDGSYNVEFLSNEYPMGYGWTTSNIENANITYSGSVKYFPSSTKAEIMAILTALITCPPKCNVTIHTDSQAAIDAFHKSKNLHSISPRRFNKINNNILWSTIHQIINTLSLNVKFIKVKAHSGDPFNDIADALAKVGHVVVSPTIIKHNNLPNQSLTIEWNEEIP